MFDKPNPFWLTPSSASPRHDPQASVPGLHRREIARGADQPEAGRHRPTSSRISAPATPTGVIHIYYHVPQPAAFRQHRDEGRRRRGLGRRAVLQTGEYDFAWNLQVEDEVLVRLERGGKGRVQITEGAGCEHLQLQQHRPLDRGRWRALQHEAAPLRLTDPAVRKAMALLIDRKSVQDHIYGRTGIATANGVNNPPRFRSPNTSYEFNVDKANALLDAAGWFCGVDGFRAKGGVKLKHVYQTSTNQPRQKTQAIVKQACARAGIDIEIKLVVASVFFVRRGQPGHLPEVLHSPADYNTGPGRPDPGRLGCGNPPVSLS